MPDDFIHERVNKHLIPGPKGERDFCFPKTLNFACVTQGLSLSVLLYFPTQKQRILEKKTVCTTSASTNTPQFQGALPHYMPAESSSCYLPRELTSFIHPGVTCDQGFFSFTAGGRG